MDLDDEMAMDFGFCEQASDDGQGAHNLPHYIDPLSALDQEPLRLVNGYDIDEVSAYPASGGMPMITSYHPGLANTRNEGDFQA